MMKSVTRLLFAVSIASMLGMIFTIMPTYAEPGVSIFPTVVPTTVPAAIPSAFIITITNTGPDAIGMVSISMDGAWGTPLLTWIKIDGTLVPAWHVHGGGSGPGLLTVSSTGNPSNNLQVNQVMEIAFTVTAPLATGSYRWTITANRNRGLGGPTVNVVPSILVIPEIPLGTLGTIIAMTLGLAAVTFTSKRKSHLP